MDYVGFATERFDDGFGAQEITERLLGHAVKRDDGRPGDDMAVVALRIAEHHEERFVRRMQAYFPMP